MSSQKSKKAVQSRVTETRQQNLRTTASTLKLITDEKKLYSVSEIANIRKTTTRNIYKLIKKYKKDGLINEDKELLQAGSELIKMSVHFTPMVSNLVQFNNEVRAHDLQFRCDILQKPDNWDEHRTTITSIKKYNPKKFKFGSSVMQDLVIDNVKVRVTPKCVLVRPADIYASEPTEAIDRAVSVLDSVVPLIENLFSIKVRKDRKCTIKITRQHIALVHNHIAQYCRENKIFMSVRDETGKLRLITDNSLGRPELEAINPAHAEDDIRVVEENLKDMILNEFYQPSVMSKMLGNIALSMKELGARVNNLAEIQANSVHLQDNTVKMVASLLPKAPEPQLEQPQAKIKDIPPLRGYG